MAHACPTAVAGGPRAIEAAEHRTVSGHLARLERGAVHLPDGVRLIPQGAAIPTRLTPVEGLAEAAETAAQAVFARRTIIYPVEGVPDRHGRLAGPALLRPPVPDIDGPVADAPNQAPAGASPRARTPPTRPAAISGERTSAEGTDLGLALVAAGAAYADPDRRPTCAAALLTAEARARSEKRGLWSVTDGLLTRTGDAVQSQGLFRVIEGRVRSVRKAGQTLYLNLAGMAGRGVSAALPANAIEGLDTAILTGTLIRIRGFVEGGDRPVLAVSARAVERIGAGRGERSR
ncbi:hypothetical protein [Aquabacter spiritensis]|uniref:Nuclease-like protein n=1 Tax=Aquabacter spiritensis TaxID=933073 RepID=A0A4R3LYX2_9HYPH|nr:hypothetical protein [Aquabacter spiritensis]TCT05456.1 hypothetical protein EDC64_10411 [Aquabacter spiritensis]